MAVTSSLIVILLLLAHQACMGQIISLKPYTIEPGSLSVSGISAGGAMATQFHVAFSKDVNGVGIFAGLPYGCAKGSLTGATNCMYSPFLTNVNTLITRTDDYAKGGSIDATSNMATDKVYVFHGTKDGTVNHGNADHIVTYYKHYLNSDSQIATELTLAAAHCHPTDNFGTACGTVNSQYYINNCNYKGSFEMLNHMYGGTLKPGVPAVAANMHEFDQKEFFPLNKPSSSSMDDTGFVYIPTECRDPTRLCKIHVAFHGCQQGAYKIGDVYIMNTGYIEVAEANAIIVVFPQAVASSLMGNPNGCFDWWAYTTRDYDTKDGEQMDAVFKMVQALGYVPA